MINRPEDISLSMVKVDEADVEVLPIAVAGVAIAVADKPEGVAQTLKVSLTGDMPQVIDHLIDIAVGETGIMI